MEGSSQDNLIHNILGLSLVSKLVGKEDVSGIKVNFNTKYIQTHLLNQGIIIADNINSINKVNFSLWAQDIVKRYIDLIQNEDAKWLISGPTNWYIENPVKDEYDDYSGDEEAPRWSYAMYHDGYIIAAFSKFVYLIKIENSLLFNTSLYQFDEIANNNFNTIFSTFGQYANWLQDRVGETIYWFLDNGYWNNSFGMKKSPNDDITAEINMQIGFARAFLFNGLTANNQDFLDKANLFKSNIYFYDRCEDEIYDFSVFRTNDDNAYWWYHNGLRIPKRNWWSSHFPYYHTNEPKYSAYTNYIKDVGHGAIVTWLPYNFYFYQPNTPFTTNDLIRFRNTFTAYPNPFKKFVKLQFSINEKSTITLQIRDLYGNLLFTIFENRELKRGISICFLTINNSVKNIKIIKLD